MIELLAGDCRELLPLMPAGVIQCAITSPPYFGLRDYGVAGQLGLEQSVEQYVAELVAIFREVRRTLRDDGTLWLNLGDSYASAWPCPRRSLVGQGSLANGRREARPPRLFGLKEKDLMGIPWRVAFALQADGWYLRSDIIWTKGNPMPESVRDRPTRAHEYLFLFAKRASYYYDRDAIREPHTSLASPPGNRTAAIKGRLSESYGRPDATKAFHPLGRNKRSWWPINTRPYRDAHFATFPPELVRPCLLAGSSPHACARCRAPYRRVVEYGEAPRDWQQACGGDASGEYHGQATKEYAAAGAQDASAVKARILAGMKTARTVDWHPSCSCERGPSSSCWVLDPFGGSGTVAVVAQELGRHALLLELNPEYVAMAKRRLEKCDAETNRPPLATPPEAEPGA